MIEMSSTGAVAIVRLAHGKANAMSIELCEELTKRLTAVDASSARAALASEASGQRGDFMVRAPDTRPEPGSSARAVVLVGTGRMFSAGVDLPRLLDGGAAYVREFLPALCKMFATVFSYPKPIVAAINGHAIAGGCVLACACDRRLMARDAGRIGVTELLVGVPFPAIAMEIMRAAAAPQHFENLLFGGATYAPEEASGLGLVDEIVAPDALLDRAVAAAQTLAALSPSAFALTKRQTRQPAPGATAARRHRCRGDADLDGARNARPHPGLRVAHVQEIVTRRHGARSVVSNNLDSAVSLYLLPG